MTHLTQLGPTLNFKGTQLENTKEVLNQINIAKGAIDNFSVAIALCSESSVDEAIIVNKFIERAVKGFSSGAVVLALSAQLLEELDYVKNAGEDAIKEAESIL